MMNILSICLNPSNLQIIRFIRLIIDLVRIIIPIVLMGNIFYNLIKYFIKLWDFEVQNTFFKVLKNSFISLSIYFIPLIIISFINIIFPEYKNCTNVNLNIIQTLYINEIDNKLPLLNDDINYNELDNVKKIVSNIKNEELKKEYTKVLDKVKKEIDSNIYFKNNYGGNIYVGDSRTLALKNIVEENEIVVSKNGGKLNDFLNQTEKIKEILNKNKGKTYNIVLNYGVNDLNNVYGYCAAYTNFLNDINSSHKIYLVSVYPVNDETKRVETKNVLKFNDIIKSCMSKVENLTYCDVYNSATYQDWLDKYLLPDGIHYNRTGNEYIHDKVVYCIKNGGV